MCDEVRNACPQSFTDLGNTSRILNIPMQNVRHFLTVFWLVPLHTPSTAVYSGNTFINYNYSCKIQHARITSSYHFISLRTRTRLDALITNAGNIACKYSLQIGEHQVCCWRLSLVKKLRIKMATPTMTFSTF